MTPTGIYLKQGDTVLLDISIIADYLKTAMWKMVKVTCFSEK